MPHRLLFRWVLYNWWLLVLSSLLPTLALAQTPPTFDMAARVLAPTRPRPYSQDVVVDAAGNSYISGQVTEDAYFGTTTVSTGQGNVYVAKLDAAGNYRWIVQLATGNSALTTSTKLALDASGNVYLASIFTTATLTLGTTTLTNVGGNSFFVGKLDPSGNWLSAVRGGGGGSDVRGLAIDREGNAYVTGSFTGSTAFGATTLVSAGGQDYFVARLDAAGDWRWAVRGGGTGADWTTEVGLDANGYAYVAGRLDSGRGPVGTFNVAGATTAIIRLTQLTGAVQQVAAIDGFASQGYYLHLAVAPTGACYVAGYFLGELRLGSLTLTSVGRGISNDDTFVAKLDATGTWQWANLVTGTSGEFGTGVAVDARSQVYVTGYFRGPGSHFGATTLVPQNSTLFFADVFVAKLDAQGKWLWAVPAGGLQEDTPSSLALGPYATPYVTGDYFSSSMRFGPLTIPGDPNLVGSTFVARMQPNLVGITGDSLLCSGGAVNLTASTLATAVSWRWNTGATTATITVTQPGVYTATASFAGGYSLSEQFEVRNFTPSPPQITGAAAPVCPGTPRQLTVVAPGASSVLWSTGAKTPAITVTQAGTYSVVAMYGAGCTVTAQATVTNNELRISGRAQLCPGQSTTLAATVTGSPATSYRWNTGATTATLRVGQAGTYSVTAILADGCQLTATHSVGPPVAKVASINGDTLLCPGTTLALTALNPDALTYRWTTGATTPAITATQPGLYGVVLTFAGGCSSRDSLRVLAALPAPAFTLGPDTTLCTDQALLLRAPAASGPGVSWRWSDGSTGPTLLVRTAGTYSLRLSTPCDSRTMSRQVAFGNCLVVPNIITPNGDQQNDRFALPHLPLGNWALTLYNRWGRQVYHTEAYRQDWGGEAPAGLYYYLLRQDQTNTSYRGWLEVVR